jgi:hypothetical protein
MREISPPHRDYIPEPSSSQRAAIPTKLSRPTPSRVFKRICHGSHPLFFAKPAPSPVYRILFFPRQEWLRERASVLRFTYISCLVFKFYFALLKHGSSLGCLLNFSSKSSPGWSILIIHHYLQMTSLRCVRLAGYWNLVPKRENTWRLNPRPYRLTQRCA